MSQQTYEIILGNAFTIALADGEQLRADRVNGTATDSDELTASDGEVVYTPGTEGVYYLATREDSGADWCRLGELHVVALVDRTAERLRAELAALDTRLEQLDALINVQVSDPSGTAVTRVQLNQVRLARSRAETRLADYLRRRQGRYPGVMH